VCNERGSGFAIDEGCGYLFCVDGQCVDPAPLECPAGATFCMDDRVFRCSNSGDMVALVEACGERICVDAACETVACEPLSFDCVDETSRICNAFGTGYERIEACQLPERCVAGHCLPTLCDPGVHCSGSRLTTCSERGDAILAQQECAPRPCVVDHCADEDGGVGDGGKLDAPSREDGGTEDRRDN
jgi:hypothetical protein